MRLFIYGMIVLHRPTNINIQLTVRAGVAGHAAPNFGWSGAPDSGTVVNMSDFHTIQFRVDKDTGNLVEPICRKFANERGKTLHNNPVGGYWAVLTCDVLPKERSEDGFTLCRGGAVGWGGGPWGFFEALPPAAAFGRAARMSSLCSGYGVFDAVEVTAFCLKHLRDEKLLLIGDQVERDRLDELITQFAQSVKRHPETAHWAD